VAQILEAVNTGVVSVAEFEMDGVLPDKFDLLELDGVRDVDRQDDALTRHFILTGGAGTQSAKKRRQVTRLVTVRPEDLQFSRTKFLDLCRSSGIP